MHCRHTLHTSLEVLHTHTPSALRARQLSIRSVLLSARNVIPHLYSYSFLIFFYSPLHSHCDSKGRAYLKLTPAPWYPLRIPTRYYSSPAMGSATWRTSRMNGMEMLNSRAAGRKRLPHLLLLHQASTVSRPHKFFSFSYFPSFHLHHLPLFVTEVGLTGEISRGFTSLHRVSLNCGCREQEVKNVSYFLRNQCSSKRACLERADCLASGIAACSFLENRSSKQLHTWHYISMDPHQYTKCEGDWMNGCRDNWRTDRQTDRDSL